MLKQIINGRILTPQGWLEGGSVIIDGNKIKAVSNRVTISILKLREETFSSADLNSSADKDFLLGNVVVVTNLLLLLLSELLLSLLSQPQNTTATHNANAKSDNIFFINIT